MVPNGPILVRVRDGRVGRDPRLVHDGLGEVLGTFRTDQPVDIEDVVQLPHGPEVVIGVNELWLPVTNIATKETTHVLEQDVSVGTISLWDLGDLTK
jgi:hypothetical protein